MAQPQQKTPAIQTIVLMEQNKIKQNDPNGTFSINLKHPVTLNDGDAINLSKSFIDTSNLDTDFITIEPDETELTITTGLYLNDIEKNKDANETPDWGYWSMDPTERPRGTTFILQNHSEAPLHSFLNWTNAANPASAGSSVPDFNLELTTIDKAFVEANPSYADMLNVAHYVLTGAPVIPPGTPADPGAEGQAIEQKFLLGGFVNNVTINNKHELFYYHRTAIPSQINEFSQNHVAIFDSWIDTDGTTRLGWKARQNPASTFPSLNPPFQRWYFISEGWPTGGGYNYFSNGGLSHRVKMDSVKFPVYGRWNAGLGDTLLPFPAVELKYIDSSGKTKVPTQQVKTFNKYLPTQDPTGKIDTRAGINELFIQLDRPKGYPPSTFIKHEDLPEPFQKLNGWGRDWYWYVWDAWQDPLDPSSPRCFQPIEFDIDEPPVLSTPTFTADGKTAVFRAFGNQSSQFAVRDPNTNNWTGNTIQPWQMSLKPVSNPSTAGCTLTPRIYTTKITIPPRDYTYSDLAQLITDNLNTLSSPVLGLQNNPDDVNCPRNAAGFSSTYLLQSSYDLCMQFDGLETGANVPIDKPTYYPNNFTFSAILNDARTAADGTEIPEIPAAIPTDPGKQPYWVSEDGTDLFQFNAIKVLPKADGGPGDEAPRVCGAENFSLVFDETSNRFKILQAHTPIYIDGPQLSVPNAPKVVFGPGSAVLKQLGGKIDPSIGFRRTQLTMDSATGVFIYDLQPRSLWFNKMRFDSSILTPLALPGQVQDFLAAPSEFAGATPSDGTLAETKTYPMSLTTGVNKTGYFTGVDILIQKNQLFGEINAAGGEDIEVTTPVGLDANPLTTASDDQPFYNIEMSGINNQEFVGQTFDNSLIQGLVGKYYSQGNFTESESDGIQYIHRGEPLVIQSIRTRILNTQLDPEPNLGPNSAFILTINKTK
tara:strand:- start:71 stop:2869 length:2799 start_codon:yes stop_codon:yes gene_type:complete